jgi:cobalt/nickel transport system permease protein
VSVEGTWAAWNILAKATLGLLAATVLAATTDAAALLAGLRRLRCPTALLAIAGFMVRYLDVLADQSRRLQVARVSRGDDPRWLWQGRAVAHGAGTLFVRSYERGERVALAMAARGYTGTMPDVFGGRAATAGEWAAGLLVPAAAAAVTAIAVLA